MLINLFRQCKKMESQSIIEMMIGKFAAENQEPMLDV